MPRPIHEKAEFQYVTEITDLMAGHDLMEDIFFLRENGSNPEKSLVCTGLVI
jgi:hypothetical protein